MVEKDQVLPLAPSTNGRSTNDAPVATEEAKVPVDPKIRRKRCLKICGFITAAFLLIAILIIILMFTLFRVRNPIIKLDGVEINNHGTFFTGIPQAGTNITLTAHVTVKNPNIASFRYPNTTTMLYYHENVVGEARGPPGKARARRSQRITATVDLITGRVIADPNLLIDVASGTLKVASYTRVGGRMRMLKFVQRHVVVTMNCTMTISVASRSIQEQKCKRRVHI